MRYRYYVLVKENDSTDKTRVAFSVTSKSLIKL